MQFWFIKVFPRHLNFIETEISLARLQELVMCLYPEKYKYISRQFIKFCKINFNIIPIYG